MARPNRLQEESERLLTVGGGLPLELVRIPGGSFWRLLTRIFRTDRALEHHSR